MDLAPNPPSASRVAPYYLRKTNTTPNEPAPIIASSSITLKADRYAPYATGWMGRSSDTKCRADQHKPSVAVSQPPNFKQNEAVMERYLARRLADKEQRLADCKITPSQASAKVNNSCTSWTCCCSGSKCHRSRARAGPEYLLEEENCVLDSDFVEELTGSLD